MFNEVNSYDIELERLKNPFELVNFIFHLLHKMFVNEKDMYEFLEAIDMLLNPEYDPLFRKNNEDKKNRSKVIGDIDKSIIRKRVI